MNSSSDNLEPVELLADEFMERKRRGEQPTIDDYCQLHPELAGEIRDVFPALMLMEDVAPASADLDVSKGAVVSPSQAPMSLIGDYRILREIGRGGMGVVYEAEQESLGRRVALKVLPRHAAGDENALLRFQQEARAAARMHHTNIVPVFEVGQDQDVVFYAMQLIHGQGLERVVNDLRQIRSERIEGDRGVAEAHSLAASLVAGKFEPDRLAMQDDHPIAPVQPAMTETIAVANSSTSTAKLPGQSELSSAEDNRAAYFRSVAEIGLQTAQALAYANARGIIHRDIKPSNLLLDTAGTVWVTDFGLAKTGDSNMTQTGDILGTIRYMSPERFNGQCDVRADVYSLGLTLYEMVVLKPAFDSPDRLKLMNMVLKEEPAPPRSIDPRVPLDLETVILKACDKDPRRRYQSADDLAEDLQRFANDEPIRARRVSTVERCVRWSRRNKALAASLVTVATLVSCVAVGSTIAANHFRLTNRALVVEETKARDAAEQANLAATKNAKLAATNVEVANKALRLKSEAEAAREVIRQQQDVTRRNLYAAQINTARYAAQVGDTLHSRTLLEQWSVTNENRALRGWEWYLQYAEITAPTRDIQVADQSDVVATAKWSPDGERFVVGLITGELVLVDAKTEQTIGTAVTQAAMMKVTQWSPNGDRIVTAGQGRVVEVWDAETLSPIREIKVNSSRIWEVDWHPNRDVVAFADSTGKLEVVDLQEGKSLAQWTNPDGEFEDVAWSPDGNRLVAAGRGSKLRVYDATTWTEAESIDTGLAHLTSVDWHRDSGRIAVSGDGALLILDGESRTIQSRIEIDSGNVSANWSPDGNWLSTVHKDGPITIRSADSGVVRWNIARDEQSRWWLDWSPDSSAILSPADDGVVTAIRIPNQTSHRMETDSRRVYAVEWHPDGQLLATGGDAGVIELWDNATQTRLHVLADPKSELSRVTGICFNHDGTLVAAGGRSLNNVLIWNVESGALVRRLEGHALEQFEDGSGIRCVDWCGVTNRIVAGDNDKNLYVWSVETGALDASARLSRAANELQFLPGENHRYLAIGNGDGVAVWNVNSMSEVVDQPGPHETYTYDIAVSGDGLRLAACHGQSGAEFRSSSGGTRVWEIITDGDNLRLDLSVEFSRIGEAMRSVSFTPDSTRLISAAYDGKLQVWNVMPGYSQGLQRHLMTIDSHEDWLNTVRVEKGGTQVATAGSDGAIHVWNPSAAYAADLSPILLSSLEKKSVAGLATSDDLKLKAQILVRQGDWSAAIPTLNQLLKEPSQQAWFASDLWVLDGAYPGDLEREFEPERIADIRDHDVLEPVRLIETGSGKTPKTARWSPRPLQPRLAVDLGKYYSKTDDATGYGLLRVFVPQPRKLGVVFGADDSHRLWLNGALIDEDTTRNGAKWDEHATPVTMKKGWNTLLLKVVNYADRHGFFLTISDSPRLLAPIYASNGRTDEALELLDQWCNQQPVSPVAWVERALLLRELGQYDRADADFERVLSMPDQKAYALKWRSRAYWRERRFDKDFDDVGEIAQYPIARQWALDTQSEHAARAGRFALSSKVLESQIELEPDEHFHMFQALFLLDKLDEGEAYRQLRERALRQFQGTGNPYIAERIGKTSLLRDVDQDVLDRVESLMEPVFKARPGSSWYGAMLAAQGMLRYRQAESAIDAGDSAEMLLDEAISYFKKARGNGIDAEFAVIRDSHAALALYRRGRVDAANLAFANATRVLQEKCPGHADLLIERWQDDVAARRFHAEAGRLIHGAGHDDLLEAQRMLELGKYQQAGDKLLTALKRSPDSLLIWQQVAKATGRHLPGATALVATSIRQHQLWEVCYSEPEPSWMTETGESNDWRLEPAPFGSYPISATPAQPWPTGDSLWIRTEFHLEEVTSQIPVLRVRADCPTKVYMNGILAGEFSPSGNTSGADYVNVPCNQAAVEGLKVGRNVLAAEFTREGKAAVDVGLYLPNREVATQIASVLHENVSDSEKDALARCKLLAQLGRWGDAATAMNQHLVSQPDSNSVDWMQGATLYAIAYRYGEADLEDCHKFLRRMIERFRESVSMNDIERTAKVCCLVHGGIDLNPPPIGDLRRAIDDESTSEANRFWFRLCLALIQLRKGDPIEALKQSQQMPSPAIPSVAQSFAKVIESLAEFELNHADKGRSALANSKQLLESQISLDSQRKISGGFAVDAFGNIQHDALIVRLLLAEANEKAASTKN